MFFVLFRTLAESAGEYKATVKYLTGRTVLEKTGKTFTIIKKKIFVCEEVSIKQNESLFKDIIPTSQSWFTVTNKVLPVLPALISLGGVKLSESAALTDKAGCWLSLSEHVQMQSREQGAGTVALSIDFYMIIKLTVYTCKDTAAQNVKVLSLVSFMSFKCS